MVHGHKRYFKAVKKLVLSCDSVVPCAISQFCFGVYDQRIFFRIVPRGSTRFESADSEGKLSLAQTVDRFFVLADLCHRNSGSFFPETVFSSV